MQNKINKQTKQSFHFAPRKKGETFVESIKRLEYYMAMRAGMGKNTKAIDIGCGVGGPMRNIQQFTDADITGVTLNEYQVKVGNKYCEQKGISNKCRLIQGDFQNYNNFLNQIHLMLHLKLRQLVIHQIVFNVFLVYILH